MIKLFFALLLGSTVTSIWADAPAGQADPAADLKKVETRIVDAVHRNTVEEIESRIVYAGCTFTSSDPIEIVMLHPTMEARLAGVNIHQLSEKSAQFSVSPQVTAAGQRLLRLKIAGKDKRILDILINVRENGGDLRLGKAGKDTPESFEMDTDMGMGMGGIGLTGQMAWQFSRSFHWGFLGMGGGTDLAVLCKVPMPR